MIKVGLENATGVGLRPLCRLVVAAAMDQRMRAVLNKAGAREHMSVADREGAWWDGIPRTYLVSAWLALTCICD